MDVKALAKKAGCGTETMRKRLERHTPAEAVAMGPADTKRNRKTIKFEGKQYGIRKLAEMFGYSDSNMAWRLANMTVKEACVPQTAIKKCYGKVSDVAPGWGDLNDNPRTLALFRIPAPTVFDEKYGSGPINEMDTKI